MSVRVYLQQQLSEIGQYSYIVCFAVDSISSESPGDISAAVPGAVAKLVRDRKKRFGSGNKINIAEAAVRRRLPGLQRWLIQSLIVRLDGVLHGVLDQIAGRNPAEDSCQIESDISALLKESRKGKFSRAYKDVILLAVYRNCLLHADGRLMPERHKRLLDAGWKTGEWEQRISWADPGFEDFLLFKSAVRTIGNACIHAAGSAPR